MADIKKDQSAGDSCEGSSPDMGCCKTLDVSKDESFPWIRGFIKTSTGELPQIATRLTFKDILGSWRARWTLSGRMNYKIPPGLYAIGNPDAQSPVLVTANYKMSFDQLRRELGNFNLWIMVLDTKGINVWCAAGKGTFGTAELVKRLSEVNITAFVAHRTLILPQLGAPGVAAHEVFKQTGFKVIYGPVLARDVPEFLMQGMKATATMREVRFGLLDRLVLTPIELMGTIKAMLLAFTVLFIVQWISHGSATFNQLILLTLSGFLPYLGAVLSGTVLVPVLLPFIPGRALSWKGWLLGFIWAGIYIMLTFPTAHWMQDVVYLLLLPPIASFLGMNFTGATTYTSLSGVVREMKIALPAQMISAGLGILFLIGTWVM